MQIPTGARNWDKTLAELGKGLLVSVTQNYSSYSRSRQKGWSQGQAEWIKSKFHKKAKSNQQLLLQKLVDLKKEKSMKMTSSRRKFVSLGLVLTCPETCPLSGLYWWNIFVVRPRAFPFGEVLSLFLSCVQTHLFINSRLLSSCIFFKFEFMKLENT